MTAAELAAALGAAEREGKGWRCRCPAHDDADPSLSIVVRNGKTLLTCRAGCDQHDVLAELRRRGLWGEERPEQPFVGKNIIATYAYRDAEGRLRYQVVRLEPKSFRQRRPNGWAGNWIWKMDGVAPLPYRLAEFLEDPDAPIFITEGEKDADALATLGLLATCNHGGAGKWRPEISQWFSGRHVIILPDNDGPGRNHAHDVARKLTGITASLRIVELPDLPVKGDVSDWLAAGGTAEQLDEFVRLAPDVNSRPTDLPTIIIIKAGERHKAADAAIQALVDAGTPIYQRDRALVRVCLIKAKNHVGEIIETPGIAAVTPAILSRLLAQAATWQRVDMRTKKPSVIDPPDPVIRQILDMIGDWPFPPLTGVIGCPTLRPDGSLLSAPGYDARTGLALHQTLAMPALLEQPSFDDATAALATIAGLLTEFPFDDELSRSVALSAILTPVLRGAMPTCPLHLITAPEAGTGKSYLADLVSLIATGEQAAVIATAPSAEETEKRLIGAALAGHPIITLDNCRAALEGDFLCQLTERPLLQLRALGKSDNIRVTNSFSTLATGNNAAVADDMIRRTISCRLDANTEQPETRAFRQSPANMIRQDRGKYVAACLTIGRAYLAAGKGKLPSLPSYEAWSDLVRSALVWLGMPDPVASMESLRGTDPVRQQRAAVFSAWRFELPAGRHQVADVIDFASTRPGLRAALLEVAASRDGRDEISSRRLGKWLVRNENTISGRYKLIVDRSDANRPRWSVEAIS